MNDIVAYESFYKSDDEGFEKYQVLYRRKMLIKLFNEHHHKNVLEIGCGLEPLFSFLDLTDTECYTVIEPVEHFCMLATKANNHEKVRIINQYLENYHSEEKSEYDLVICSSLLHEVNNQGEFLKQIRKLSSANTIVHINVPNAFSFHRLLAKEMNLIEDIHEFSKRDQMRQHTKVFDLLGLEEMLNNYGFEIIEKGSYFIKPFTHDQMIACIDAGIITEKMLEGLNRMIKYMPEFGSEIYCNVRIKEKY